MKNNIRGLWAIVTIGTILALQPLDIVYGDDSRPFSYSFVTIDIPTSDGQIGFTSLQDINSDGEIVGLALRGFLIEKFRITDIECPRVLSTAPLSINKHGEIVGTCGDDEIQGFLRNRKGRYKLLKFPRAILTEAVGINDDSQIVGDYQDKKGVFHGFFWDDGHFLTIDVPFRGATATGATAINNRGQIVGVYLDNNGVAHGFLYDHGKFSSLDFPGALATFPFDINDRGHIVGIYLDPDGVFHGFVSDDGEFTTVDVTILDAIQSETVGINNHGQIVGRYIDSNFQSHGFVATPQREREKEKVVGLSPRFAQQSESVGTRSQTTVASQAGSILGRSKLLEQWKLVKK
jgi:probable HAF family extracellular repeat protein